MALAGTIAYDTIDGVLVERHVSIKSGFVGGQLSFAMNAAAKARNAGLTFPSDVGYEIFGGSNPLRFPDVSFISAERLSPDETSRTFFRIPPDIVAEVVSPSDRANEVESKALGWIAAGAQLVWVLFPGSQTIHVYRADGHDEILGPDDTLSGEGLLPGFEINVSELIPLEITLSG